MSHTIQNVFPSPIEVLVQFTIVNYTVGGETVQKSEVNLPQSTLSAIFFMPTTNNSLNKLIQPVLAAGKVKLLDVIAGTEVPTTVGLNCVINAMAYSDRSTFVY